MPRRNPPPPGYPGGSSYYRPTQNWRSSSTRWYYRPYYYDPYGWRHFGWSPLYYVPWSLVWGVNTPYAYGSIGFGYPYAYGSYAYGGSGYGAPYYPYSYGGSTLDTGGVRLRIRPRDAQVFVDGYYAGLVEDFDGSFQSVRLAPGGHKIEIRMPGFETLELDVHVQPGRTITFKEDLRASP